MLAEDLAPGPTAMVRRVRQVGQVGSYPSPGGISQGRNTYMCKAGRAAQNPQVLKREGRDRAPSDSRVWVLRGGFCPVGNPEIPWDQHRGAS